MYDDDDDDDDEQDEEEDYSGADGSEDDEEEEEMGSFEDLEAEEGQDSAGNDDEDEDDSESEPEEEQAHPPPKKVVAKKASAKQLDDKAMLSQLKQAASADVEKGRDVKKQLVSLRDGTESLTGSVPDSRRSRLSAITCSSRASRSKRQHPLSTLCHRSVLMIMQCLEQILILLEPDSLPTRRIISRRWRPK